MSPPPPTGTKTTLALAQDLGADRALSGDDQRVVERVHQGQAALRGQGLGAGLRFRVAVAGQHHLRAQLAHGLDLDLGGGLRHDDHGADPEVAGGERDALRVVARTRRHHAPRAFLHAQVRDAVVRAADLVAEHGLEVLALQEHGVAEAAGEARRRLQRRLPRDVIDAAGEDVVQQPAAASCLHSKAPQKEKPPRRLEPRGSRTDLAARP